VDENPAVGITNAMKTPMINSLEKMLENTGINDIAIMIAVIIVGKIMIRIAEM